MQSEWHRIDEQYPVLIPPFLKRRMEQGNYGVRAARQYYPDIREVTGNELLPTDACNEGEFKESDQLIVKYSNRAALIVTHRCLGYCRFCFRKDFVGKDENTAVPDALEQAISHIERNSAIKDVLISGGDPMALPNRELLPIMKRLSDIDHLSNIRIHTRAISTNPRRVDREFLDALMDSDKFWIYTHMNHIEDLEHEEVLRSLKSVQATGVPVLNQAVILGGVNDSVQDINVLMEGLYRRRIIPYHLYVFDVVRGAAHFDVSAAIIGEIFAGLSNLPGPAQPVMVLVDSSNLKRRFVFDYARGAVDLMEVIASKSNGCAIVNEKSR